MPEDRKFAKDNIENLTTADLLDAMYGSIQALIERGAPDNIAFQYFLPPIPFGPELAAFMDIGSRPKELDNEDEEGNIRYTVNDMMRSAVNLAVMADYVPTVGTNLTNTSNGESDQTSAVVDLNSLISSGRSISDIYGAVLENCKVVNNSPTEEEKKRLEKLRSVLFREPKPAPAEAEDGDLLSGLEGEDLDLELGSLLTDGVEAGDFVQDPDKLSEPTRVMQLYQALQTRYEQVKLSTLEKLATISPNDPNAGEKVELYQDRIRAAERMWEAQGNKTQVEAILARIEQLSRAGMPEYVEELRARFDANQLKASVFASEESGVSLLTEQAYYTALRPNGILNAPTMMKITLESSNTESWRSMSKTSTEGSGFGIIPALPLFGRASGEKVSEDREREFFSEGFTIEYEIVQGIFDRPWLSLAFLESPAYTTVDPVTKDSLSLVDKQITTLSDGKQPPDGQMPLVPMTVYFIRNLTIRSRAFASMSESERDKFAGKAGVSFLGFFGARGSHTSDTTTSNWSRASTRGEIQMEGIYLVGFASRFLDKAPDPDFESFPDADDWI